jgi:predicted dehydrogenase
MNAGSRRKFVSASALSLAATAARAAAPAGKVTIGVIGVGGMGANHLNALLDCADVDLAYVCDVDQKRLDEASRAASKRSGSRPTAVRDLRKVLDDPRVEAVFIATPDHWHAPAAILALDAGKHVYVEKPCCHNIREGRLLAEAVARTGKLLQVGTQSRSGEVVRDAIRRVHEGRIGEVLVAKAWNSQLRRSIGKTKPGSPPSFLDFDLWLGPAPRVPYRDNLLPSIWRWWYDFGCGDIGNDGVHDIDVALWGLGAQDHPSSVSCLGGKYFFDDDQQFPDTQYAVFEYPVPGSPAGRRKQLIFEQRIWSPYVQEGYENGAAFYGTQGMLVIGHSVGWKMYGPRNKLIAERQGSPDLRAHHRNFFEAIRGKAKLNADVHAGRLSATLVHLANIAARTGKALTFDPASERITSDAAADALVRRRYREGHWAAPKGV